MPLRLLPALGHILARVLRIRGQDSVYYKQQVGYKQQQSVIAASSAHGASTHRYDEFDVGGLNF